jgi:type III secretion protein D
MSAEPRELRILDGLHAGARAPLAPRLSIGSSLDNDIVLSDPGIQAQHAQLQWDATSDAWLLLRDGASDGASDGPRLALGEVVSLGPVRVTVAAANNEWVLTVAPLPAQPAAAEAVEQTPAAIATVVAPEAPAINTARAAAPRAATKLALALAATLLLFTAIGATLFALRAPAAPAPLKASNTTTTAPSVADVLRNLGLQNRLQLSVKGSPAQVSGVLEDEAQLERLAAALARASPRPAMRVWSLPGLRAQLREGGLTLPRGGSLGLAPAGEVIIGGPGLNRSVASDLQERARALLPAHLTVQSELDRPELLLRRVVAEARAQGFLVSGAVENHKLVLEAHLPSADVARWESWLAAYAPLNLRAIGFAVKVHLPQTAQAARTAPTNPRTAAAAPMPWRIRSVVGGTRPYLVLDDGTTLLPGALHQGALLVAIRDQELVIEQAGRQRTWPR